MSTGNEREREDWTEEDERHPEGEEEHHLLTPDGEDAALGGIDQPEPGFDPDIAKEVQLQEETREAEEEYGPVEEATEE